MLTEMPPRGSLSPAPMLLLEPLSPLLLPTPSLEPSPPLTPPALTGALVAGAALVDGTFC